VRKSAISKAPFASSCFPALRVFPSHVHVEFRGCSHDQPHAEHIANPGMHMRIDESGKQSIAGAIDDLRVVRPVQISSNRSDPTVGDHNRVGGDHLRAIKDTDIANHEGIASSTGRRTKG
jgi:hypothetical protein